MPKAKHSTCDLVVVLNSETDPDGTQTVRRDRETGALTCTCHAWGFAHDPKACKHTKPWQPYHGLGPTEATAEAIREVCEARARAVTATIQVPADPGVMPVRVALFFD